MACLHKCPGEPLIKSTHATATKRVGRANNDYFFLIEH
jgi:hypothetical protein